MCGASRKTSSARTYEVDLQNPAFDRLAAAFDVPFARAESADALQRVLGRATRDGTAILIEAPVGPMPSPWGLMRLQARPGAANAGPPNPLGEPCSVLDFSRLKSDRVSRGHSMKIARFNGARIGIVVGDTIRDVTVAAYIDRRNGRWFGPVRLYR